MIQGVSFHSRQACVRCLCSIDARFGFVTVQFIWSEGKIRNEIFIVKFKMPWVIYLS
jgi:hypothetical protein